MPLENVRIDTGSERSNEGNFSIRVYFLEIQQGFARASMLDTSLKTLRENPQSAFSASGMDIIAKNVVVESVSRSGTKSDSDDTETIVDTRGKQMLGMLGLTVEDGAEDGERSDLELDEIEHEELIFITALPDEDEHLLVRVLKALFELCANLSFQKGSFDQYPWSITSQAY